MCTGERWELNDMYKRSMAIVFGLMLLAGACSSSGDDESGSTTSSAPAEGSVTSTSSVAASTTSGPPEGSVAPETSMPLASTTTVAPSVPAISQDGDTYTIAWEDLDSPAFFAAPSAGDPDPLYFIHTTDDELYFALELYTTGYGELWSGELGEVAVSCAEAPPAANSTGVCPKLDPDGVGELPPFDGFGAAGTIRINQLDESGYDIDILELTFPGGITVAPFTVTG